MRFSRKGSMQMSIEAIIILVIAMVLLGLGLTFVKGLFGQGTDALLGKFEPIKEYCDVNKDSPMLPKTYTFNAGKNDESASVCVYNNVGATVQDGVLEIIECLTPDGDAIKLNVTPDPVPTLPADEPIPTPYEAWLDSDGDYTVHTTAADHVGPHEKFPLRILSLGENIPRNQLIGYKTAVNTEFADVGTYRCKMQIRDRNDPDVTIGPVQVVFNLE